ncbi:MAG: polysaccharide deacetylase family protein, partial [Pseudomonadota bacterium]
GHRVGIFRVLDVLEKHGLPVTLAMDALTAEHYRYLANHCHERGCEFIGHGISVSRMITSRMSEAEERDYIEQSLAALESVTGKRPRGWFGPEYGESTRTPQLLADAGVSYVCDWANDEQPYAMTTATGRLVSLPIMLELEDQHALHDRRVPIARYETLVPEGAEILAKDGESNGRLLVLHLHPWLIGQPFRIGALDRLLTRVLSLPRVWKASGSEIVDWFNANPPK